jgi:D-lactate dehydrogenase (cytochrome)
MRRREVPTETVVARLKDRFGDQVSTATAVCDQHGKDESYHPIEAPDAVFFARSTGDVVEAVKLCAEYKVPVIPFGTGTSLEGHVAAREGGICIDVTQMDQVLRVSPEDLDCTVQPGVTRKALNEYLRDTGLFFPIDPGANASIGGMTATRASGTNAVRYGTMRDNVLSLTAVLADGRVVKTASRARKSSAGYDLTRLFVGSEGTLGVITEITLKLYGIPEAISSAVCSFPSIASAVDTVIMTIQAGVPVARIELLDEVQIAACNHYSKLDLKVAPTLFFEFHGTEAGVKEQAEMVQAFAEDQGGEGFKWTSSAEERSKLWQARHDAYYAGLSMRAGSVGWATDVCVPISNLAEAINETKKDLDKASMPVCLVGHVGDGNFHLCFILDPNKPEEFAEAAEINERMVKRALALDGTCTGEHGVGYGKIGFVEDEHGPETIGVMREIKRALDPHNLMNPGKVIRVGGNH